MSWIHPWTYNVTRLRNAADLWFPRMKGYEGVDEACPSEIKGQAMLVSSHPPTVVSLLFSTLLTIITIALSTLFPLNVKRLSSRIKFPYPTWWWSFNPAGATRPVATDPGNFVEQMLVDPTFSMLFSMWALKTGLLEDRRFHIRATDV